LINIVICAFVCRYVWNDYGKLLPIFKYLCVSTIFHVSDLQCPYMCYEGSATTFAGVDSDLYDQ
jgi:hypothetical protein